MKFLSFSMMSVLSSLAFGQISTAPQVGAEYSYVPFFATIADTGAIGSGVVWDFSDFETDPSGVLTLRYRLPNAQELTNDPATSIVAEALNGQFIQYGTTPDSLFAIGFTDPTDGTYIPYSDPSTLFLLPGNQNATTHTDAFSYTYTGEFDITLVGEYTWKISGDGTLITPFQTYTNAKKVSRYGNFELYTGGILFLSFSTQEITFFNDDLSIPLMIFEYNDFSEMFTSYVYSDESSAGVHEHEWEAELFFPNPASDHIILNQEVSTYAIHSMDGKLVATGNNGGNIHLNAFTPGTYFLHLTTATGVQTQKLMIR